MHSIVCLITQRRRKCGTRQCVKNQQHFYFVSDRCKNQQMWNKVFEVDPWQRKDVPDCHRTKKMCDDVV